jgi:hypothetical protein
MERHAGSFWLIGLAQPTETQSEIGKTGCVFGASAKHGSVKSEPMRE